MPFFQDGTLSSKFTRMLPASGVILPVCRPIRAYWAPSQAAENNETMGNETRLTKGSLLFLKLKLEGDS